MTRAARLAFCLLLAGPALACKESQAPPVATEALLPDSAEQMAFGINFILTDEGVRRALVRADTLLVYDDATREELRKVTATFFTPTGEQDAVLTALQVVHNNRLGTLEARGNVVIVSTDGQQMESPHVRYDPSRQEISSDSAFTLTEGERVTKGIGFVSNPDMTNMRILRGASLSGTPVKIPKR